MKKSQDLPALLNLGFCNAYIVHNAFRKAVQEFGDVGLTVNWHYFLQISPIRVEELTHLQN